MSGEQQSFGIISLLFIIDSNLLLFQKRCRNKDCSQKLGVALTMAQEAEQISIQVGECSDYIPAPLWDLGHKANHILSTKEKWLVLPHHPVLVLELVSSFQDRLLQLLKSFILFPTLGQMGSSLILHRDSLQQGASYLRI